MISRLFLIASEAENVCEVYDKTIEATKYMTSRLIFTIGSLFFLALLLISYFTRKNKLKINNIIYRYLIIDVIILVLTEILSAFIYSSTDLNFLFPILLRVHWLAGFIFTYLFYLYTCVLINELNFPDIKTLVKSNKKYIIATIISLLFIIVYFFLPFEEMTNCVETYNFIPGTAAYFALIYMSLCIVAYIIELVTHKNANKTSKHTIITFVIIAVVLLLLQFVLKFPVLFGLLQTIEVFVLYFLIENPDLGLIEEIDMLKLSIERSSKAKSDFLSNMSHEIRSPMNAIIGFSETILSDDGEYDPNRTLNDISHIKSSSKNLLDIINNILDISKIETGSDSIENKEYSLKSHIIDWTGIVETRLTGKNIKFKLEIDEGIPSKLYGDATKIFQVVLNILTNSVKYTEVGRIKMTISKEDINNKTIKLKFKVADTGFGIKKEDYSKVFQKFSRLDSAKTNEIEGTGLGLVLTKKYAQLMGGDIWFESEYGAGTTFFFEVPQRVIDAKPMGEIDETIAVETSKRLINCSGFKALVVDDDELNLKVTERLLKAYNFDVETTSTPDEVIYKFKDEKHYDLVFLDHIMPGIDGVELMKILKGLKGYHIPPIIALTANAITGVRQQYLKEGFDEYLSKPIDVNELDKIINKFFKEE